jgi:hypothetical protein
MGIDGDDVLLKLKMKKFFAQYEYLDSELSETQYLFDIYNKDFLKECHMGKNDQEEATAKAESSESIDTVAVDVPEDCGAKGKGSERDDCIEIDDAEFEVEDANLKKLYKMLSLKTHPDKNGGDQKLFIEVKQAYQDKNIFKLIIIATKLNIDISYISDAIELFEKSISEMQIKIENFKKTIAWHWAHADEVKKQKIREYIKKN